MQTYIRELRPRDKDKVIEEIAKVSPSEIILNEISFKENLNNIIN